MVEEKRQTHTRLGRLLTAIILVAIISAIAMLAYIVALPRPRESFTEFYLLGPAGEAAGYPEKLQPGEAGEVTVGIVNLEHERVSYTVETRIDGASLGEVGPILLEHKERAERTVSFRTGEPGRDRKVEFLLYKDGGEEPDQSLHLLVDVE